MTRARRRARRTLGAPTRMPTDGASLVRPLPSWISGCRTVLYCGCEPDDRQNHARWITIYLFFITLRIPPFLRTGPWSQGNQRISPWYTLRILISWTRSALLHCINSRQINSVDHFCVLTYTRTLECENRIDGKAERTWPRWNPRSRSE